MRMPAPDGLERIDEMGVDRDELGFRMLATHVRADHMPLLLARINQDQVLPGFDIVTELLEVSVLGRDAGEAAFPRAEHRDHRDDQYEHDLGNPRAERLEEQ